MEPQARTTVLLVEDNPDHAELTMRELRKGRFADVIVWVKDGEEALDYLFRRNVFRAEAGKPLPGFILLDINLPKRSGLDVLHELKADPVLRVVPVVMLTTSGRDEEVRRSFELGANSFVTKPVVFEEFSETINQIKRYWTLTNRLATRIQ